MAWSTAGGTMRSERTVFSRPVNAIDALMLQPPDAGRNIVVYGAAFQISGIQTDVVIGHGAVPDSDVW